MNPRQQTEIKALVVRRFQASQQAARAVTAAGANPPTLSHMPSFGRESADEQALLIDIHIALSMQTKHSGAGNAISDCCDLGATSLQMQSGTEG